MTEQELTQARVKIEAIKSDSLAILDLSAFERGIYDFQRGATSCLYTSASPSAEAWHKGFKTAQDMKE